MRILQMLAAVAALLLLSVCALAAGTPASPRPLPTVVKPWKGDFNGMLERRIIRVLVPYSRTLYYVDKGHERGFTAALTRDVERVRRGRRLEGDIRSDMRKTTGYNGL